MHQLIETTSNQRTRKRRATTIAVRTYRQIADILGENEGTRISPFQVRQICLAAERKFTRAFIAEPLLHEWFAPSAVRVR